MRIATMIITFFLLIPLTVQSCAIAGLSSVVGQQEMAGGGAVGILVGFLWIIGAAFVLGKPTIALFSYALAAFCALAVGATTKFSDMTIWGIVSLVFVLFCLFGRRETKAKAKKQLQQ